MRIFVYGTLKRDYWNNSFLETSEFLGEAVTSPNYDLAARGIPYLMHGDFSVRGELYDVDEDILVDLDRLEGHPNFYRRQNIMLLEPTEHTVQAYLTDRTTLGHSNLVPVSEDGTKIWSLR